MELLGKKRENINATDLLMNSKFQRTNDKSNSFFNSIFTNYKKINNIKSILNLNYTFNTPTSESFNKDCLNIQENRSIDDYSFKVLIKKIIEEYFCNNDKISQFIDILNTLYLNKQENYMISNENSNISYTRSNLEMQNNSISLFYSEILKKDYLIDLNKSDMHCILLKYMTLEQHLKLFNTCCAYIKELNLKNKISGLTIISQIMSYIPEEYYLNAYSFEKNLMLGKDQSNGVKQQKMNKVITNTNTTNSNSYVNSQSNQTNFNNNKRSRHFSSKADNENTASAKNNYSDSKHVNQNFPSNSNNNKITSTNNQKTCHKNTLNSAFDYKIKFETNLGGHFGFFTAALDDERKEIKRLSLQAIANIATTNNYFLFAKKSFSFVLELINDEEEEVRVYALDCLNQLTNVYSNLNTEELDILYFSLQDKSKLIRRTLLKCLSNVDYTNIDEYEKLIDSVLGLYFNLSLSLRKKEEEFCLKCISDSLDFETIDQISFTKYKSDDERNADIDNIMDFKNNAYNDSLLLSDNYINIHIKSDNIKLIKIDWILNKLKVLNHDNYLIKEYDKHDFGYKLLLLVFYKVLFFRLAIYIQLKQMQKNNDSYLLELDFLIKKKLKNTMHSSAIKLEKLLYLLTQTEETENSFSYCLNNEFLYEIKRSFCLDKGFPCFFVKHLLFYSDLHPELFKMREIKFIIKWLDN